MELYLFRHGIAEESHAGGSDAARELTDEGRKKTAAIAKMAGSSGVAPSLIVSSPYKRAIETADIAADQLKYRGTIVQSDALVPHSDPQAVWDTIRDHRDETAILLAGHEPLLSHVAAFLLGAPSLRLEMKKSCMIRIDVDSLRGAPHGVLRWMITPKLAG
jgi:phosphohistidine phosphatase